MSDPNEPAPPGQRSPDTAPTAPRAGATDKPPAEPAVGAEGVEALARRDLPKWNRSRTKRKTDTAEGPDAFQSTVRDAGRAAARSSRLMLLGIVLAGGVIYGGVWFRQHQVESAAESSRLLAAAVAIEARGRVDESPADPKRPTPDPVFKDDAERSTKADEALSKLVAEAGASKSGLLGRLVRGRRHLHAGLAAEAEREYRAFLEEAGDGHELAFLAKEGLAAAAEARGDLAEAVRGYEAMAPSPGDFFRDEALWQKGRVLEANGQKAEAIATYRTYMVEFPAEKTDAMARDRVKARLDALEAETPSGDAKAPTEAAPDAKPPAEPATDAKSPTEAAPAKPAVPPVAGEAPQ